jgi:hypothetical protein
MKDRIFYNDEFEKHLKEKTDQFKMYPSDKVWNEINSTLHTRRRRFGTGMAFLIGGILILAGKQLLFPSGITNTQTIAAKINTATKPAAGASLPNFTATNFSSGEISNSEELAEPDNAVNTGLPFDLHSSITPALVTAGNELTGPSIERTSDAEGKNFHSSDLNENLKTETAAPVVDMNDGNLLSQTYPAAGLVSEEITLEKAITPPAHLHSDRFSWEIYIAPTLNTHYLTGMNYQNMGQTAQTAPIMVVHIANVNGFVDNTPVMGYDLGGNILYRISKNISLKAGLDFSMNRYYIKAYNTSQPQASAALNSYLGYIADSLSNSVSGYGTIKNPTHYQNRYYQLSMPVGIEMNIAGTGRVQLHLGATVQPSYLLNTDAYVLTDDYNSYTKDAQAFRRWNLNLGAEAFISYSVGKIRWELGPQVRYQLFSTYKNNYALKENMVNYGIRIGISKTIW